ncbi:MAG TPA: von Willebrand factor type A domain-containing protein [Vicinamibacterales bacterium]|jgi:Ca-activated chloride channel family protein|nr:von Willebrand factor type A domain-containing protein [Vicinamibacterales bacterium]
MRHLRIVALVVSAAVVALAGLGAQMIGGGDVGHITGVVADTGAVPIAGVEVKLSRGGRTARTTITNAKGEFGFLVLDPDRYEVTAALRGFRPATVWATITQGATVKLSLTLQIDTLAKSRSTDVTSPPPASPAASPQTDAADRVYRHSELAAVAGGVGVAIGGATGFASAFPGFNTESYDRITDNQWTEVGRKPLSTFSTDVDTASYSNVRRFLNQGQAPPKDAVRIEELINYFTFRYPDPRDEHPFSVMAAIGECPWNGTHKLALIGLQARRLDRSRIPPRNLVFLIDVSGSMMDANKLPLVRASLAMLVPNLTDKDRVAIVVYAGNTGLVLPSTSGGDTSTILEAIGRLQAGGSTNGGAGLMLAYKVAREHFIKGGVNRVVLATDGDFNVGVTDQGSLLRLIEENRESGVALSVLGYGMGNVKDSTMVKLADAGNGNYAYIDSLAEAQKVLVEQAGGTLVTVAKDVKLQIEFNPRVVSAYRLIGYEKRILQDQDFNNDRKDAGDIGAGHSVTALYELIPAGQPIDVPSIDPLKYQRAGSLSADAQRGEAMTVKIRYKQPDGATSSLLAVAVPEKTTDNPELGFAAAVAEFGMLLRDSEHKGSSSYANALKLAQQFKGDDPYGHRADFIRLVGAAEGITRLQTASR